MSKPAYFVQECPVCGRPLQVRVEYLGKRLACNHCGGRFVAAESKSPSEPSPSTSALLHRADELLEQSSLRLNRAHTADRSGNPTAR